MVFNYDLLANSTAWLANFIFLISFLPQIVLNRRLKTTKGLSDYFILGSLNRRVASMFYTFCLGLPLIYKTMTPVFVVLATWIVIQRFYYDGFKDNRKVLSVYNLNFLCILVVIPFAYYSPMFVGRILGWTALFASMWQKFPQVIKAHKEKSVEGFSLFFVLINIGGCLFEGIAGIFLGLPIEMLLYDLKGVFVYSFSASQFFLYRKSSEQEVVTEFEDEVLEHGEEVFVENVMVNPVLTSVNKSYRNINMRQKE